MTHSWVSPGENRCGNSVADPVLFSRPCGQPALSDVLWGADGGARSSEQEPCISPVPTSAPPVLLQPSQWDPPGLREDSFPQPVWDSACDQLCRFSSGGGVGVNWVLDLLSSSQEIVHKRRASCLLLMSSAGFCEGKFC